MAYDSPGLLGSELTPERINYVRTVLALFCAAVVFAWWNSKPR